MKKNRLKNKSVAYTLLISYIAVLAIPIIAGAFVLFNSVSYIDNEVEKSKSDVLLFVRQSVDARISGVKSFAINELKDPNAVAFSSSVYPDESEREQNLSTLIKGLRNVRLINDYVSQCNIYFKNKDIYVTPSTYYHMDTVYDAIFSYYDISVDEWNRMMNSTEKGVDIRAITTRGDRSKVKSMILVCCNMPAVYSSVSTGKILMTIDESRIASSLKILSRSDNDETFLVDENSNIIASHSDLAYDMGITYDMLAGDSGSLQVTHNGINYNVFYISSNEWNCKYVTVSPRSALSAASINAIVIACIIMFLAVLAAAVLIARNVRNNKRDMSLLLNKLRAMIGHEKWDNTVENEYKLIQNSLENMIVISKSERKQIDKQQKLIRDSVLKRLINGHGSSDPLPELGEEYSIEFISEMFGVIIFSAGSMDKFFAQEDISEAERIGIFSFVIDNIVVELIGEQNKAYTFEYEGFVICILNFANTTSFDKARELMKHISDTVVGFLPEKLGIEVSAASSDINTGEVGISTSFDQAMEAVQYQMIGGLGGSVGYADVKIPDYEYAYSFETEKKLINCIKAGNATQSKSICDDIIRENMTEKTMPVSAIRFIIYDIVGSVLKAISDIRGISDILSKEYVKRLTRTGGAYDIEEMRSCLYSMIDDTCAEMMDHNRDSHTTIINEINKYIEENYADPTLSVGKIGQHFYFSAAYCSRIYKNQTGESMLDVINQTRIKHAVELLDTTNMSIEAISAKTGFTSSTVFIRIFKKYQGITPGKYKEMK